jgi:ABC-type nitrate/sulfonate/bicarbonate transport system substrate-binding protein
MPANPAGVSFGVNAARAMEEGKIDGFWANGMGAEVAVKRGTGTLVLDARRGDGPASLRGFTFGVLASRADLVEKSPDKAAAAVRALVKTQNALKADPRRATKVGEKWFPAFEASLIASLVERDLPYYDPAISKGAFDSMCAFAQSVGLTRGVGRYEDVVATQFSRLWKS